MALIKYAASIECEHKAAIQDIRDREISSRCYLQDSPIPVPATLIRRNKRNAVSWDVTPCGS
jgi:hypothetical protein